ncbi:MAG TPA: PPOX class F420-dependent oxidoreductase [Anaerolineales bacterium]
MFPESHFDLLKTEIAMLATIGPSGYPQVTAVWFLLDDDGFVDISMKTTRQKVKNLYQHRECTLFILDRPNPGRTLEIRANAEVVPDAEYKYADKISKKYGVDIRTMDAEGESRVAVILHPVKVNAQG